MPTETPDLPEDAARDLLAKAAATIDVDPGSPLTLTGLPAPTHRRWPAVLAAAAAVAIVVSSVTLLVDRNERSVDPALPTPVESAHPIGPDQMPAVIGMPATEARRILEDRGLTVVSRRDNTTCAPDGTVVMTRPSVGAAITKGRTVFLSLAWPEMPTDGPPPLGRSLCAGTQTAAVWQLLRFATYDDPAPAFAPNVLVRVDGAGHTVAGADLRRSEAWQVCASGGCHSPLGALAEMATRTWSGPSPHVRYTSPYISIWPASEAAADLPLCDGFTELADAPAKTYAIWRRTPDQMSDDCPTPPLITVTLDAQNRIAQVDLVRAATSAGVADEQSGAQADARRAAAATRFVAWVRGQGSAPDFAPKVEQLAYDQSVRVVSRKEAADRSSWQHPCSGLVITTASCLIPDPLAVLQEAPESVVQTDTRATYCTHPFADLPAELRSSADQDLVRLDQPEPRDCRDAYAIELWIDATGEIYAVNVAVAPR
ncbi:PASTA domain-containing protein [Nocardioides montaniterrae]